MFLKWEQDERTEVYNFFSYTQYEIDISYFNVFFKFYNLHLRGYGDITLRSCCLAPGQVEKMVQFLPSISYWLQNGFSNPGIRICDNFAGT